MAKISVIMSVYKEPEDYLRESVESILKQTYKDFEYLIVIDNPQNEEAIELLKHYKNMDCRIRLIPNEENIGLPKSLNKALQYANGTYIARMDADDIADVERLEIQMKYLKRHGLQLVGCSMRRISEEGEVVSKLTNRSYPPECIKKLLRYDDCVPHPSWLVERSVYDSLDGYRDIHSCEDYDFLLRAVNRGVAIGICDEILMNYRVNTKGISRNNSLRQMMTADYLQKNRNRIEEISKEEISRYLAKKIDASSEKRYEEALKKLNEAIEGIKNREYRQAVNIFRAVRHSGYILINVKKIVKMLFIKKKYRERGYKNDT